MRPPPPAWPRCGGPPLCPPRPGTPRRARGRPPPPRPPPPPPPLPASARHAEPRQRLPVHREPAFAGSHQHLPQVVGVYRLHLKDARIVCPRRAVGALHQIHAFAERRFRGRRQHRIQVVLAALIEVEFLNLGGSRGDVRSEE